VNLDFDTDRWARVRDAYRRWWAGELGRPLINLTLRGRDPGRPEPRLPSHEFTSLYDLDALLEIEALKGVQWVPGAGQPGVTRWPEIYRKIRAAGKRIQFFTNQDERGIDSLDILADQLGGAEGIIMIGEVANEDEPRVRDLLKRYDVDG